MTPVLPAIALLFFVLAVPVAAQDALAVEIVTLTEAPVTDVIRFTGTIAARKSYGAGFRDGGRLIAVDVEVGDTVAAGARIAMIDPAQAEAALRAAQASLAAADAALLQATQDRDRVEGLLNRGNATQASFDAATESYLSARAARDQADAQLSKARRAAEDTVLRAADDAIVTERNAEPAQVVGAGQPIVTLASLAEREAVFLAPDLAGLDDFIGGTVALTAIDGPGAATATVSEISPVVSANGTVTVRARLDDPGAFAIGDPVVGQVAISRPLSVSIPWSALTATQQGPAVWRVDPDSMTVSLAPVTVSSYTDATVRIASGLSAGDQVVAAGSQMMFPGRSVRRAEVK